MNSLGKAPNTSLRLATLLLAAGEGSRLGSRPKALLKKNGQSLLRRLCTSLDTFSPVELVVVTGFHSEPIEGELQSIQKTFSLPISIVKNTSPEDGQASSVRLGLESLQTKFDVLLVALCDQPGVGGAEIQTLLDAYLQKEASQEVILPMVSGQRGNPILLSYAAVKNILAAPGMVCRQYMDRHPGLVKLMQTDLQGFVEDVDTLEDVRRQKLTLSKR